MNFDILKLSLGAMGLTRALLNWHKVCILTERLEVQSYTPICQKKKKKMKNCPKWTKTYI